MARSERVRRCKMCGAEFPAPSKTERVLCDTCRKEAKRATVVRERVCVQCGAAFPGGPSAKWCPACRIERQRQRDREYKRRGPVRQLGSTQVCERCGAEYKLEGGLQRYCPACSEDAVRENRLPKKREYQRDYDPGRDRRRALKAGVRLCVICGEPIQGDRAMQPFVTCSDACDRVRRAKLQAEADAKRSPRKRGGSE